MELTILPLDRAAALDVARWRYPPPYDVYNIGSDPADLALFLAHAADYYQIRAGAALIGFCCYGEEAQVPGGDYSPPALDLGLGVRPDLTGRGQGRRYFDAVTSFAERQFEPPALRLTVASFNQRAIRLYSRAGFCEIGRFNAVFSGRPFIVMRRAVERIEL